MNDPLEGISFEWDPRKADRNLRKHGVSFDEARTVFADILGVTISDEAHSTAWEERWATVGASVFGKLLTVAYTERGDVIRIISARQATRRERTDYEEGRNIRP